MAVQDAQRDDNRIPSLLGVDSVSFTDPTTAAVNATTHELLTTLDKDNSDVLIYANTAKDGTGTDYVPLVDSDGHLQVDLLSGGGGTEYTEDVASPAAIVGTATMIERDDALATLTPIEGDWVSLRSSAEGALWTQDFNSDAILTAVELIDNAISGAGFNITQLNGATVPIGAGLEATALRVTVATDSTGVLSVDDNLGSLTVDNAGLTELAAAINASSQMDVNIAASNATVTVTATDLDIRDLTATDVVTANLSATDNAVLDNIDADTSAIQTAVETIDNTVYSEDVATPATIIGNAVVMERDDALTTVTPIEADWIGLRGTAEGALWVQDFNSDAILADTTAILADTAAIEIATEATQAALETVGGLVVNLGANNDVTVTGTVTANLSATDNAVLDAIELDTTAIQTAVELIDNAISGAGFNITQLNGATVPIGAGLEATAVRVTVATDSTGVLSIDDNGGLITVDGTVTANLSATDNAVLDAIEIDTTATATSLAIMDDWDNAASDGASVSGDVAHDAADAGEPVKMGMKAVALKANPTEVAANDRTNWYADVSGVPFVLGGHPNILTQSLQITDADGAATDVAIITAGANVAVVVTKVSVMADNANTVDVSCRIGFGTVNTPAADAAQVLLFHPGIAAGSGVVEGSGAGIIGIGASGEDVRVTCEDPVTGSINIIVTYFTTDI